MPVIIPPGYMQITYNWTSPNFVTGRAATVFGVQYGLPVEVAANTFGNAAETALLPVMDTTVELSTVEAITETQGAEIAVGVAGADQLTAPPPNVATLVRKLTDRRGRRAQGRLFFPGMIDEADVSELGVFLPAALTIIQTAVSAWLTEIEGSGETGGMVILQNSEGISEPLDPPPSVTGLVVDSRVASQRRRLR